MKRFTGVDCYEAGAALAKYVRSPLACTAAWKHASKHGDAAVDSILPASLLVSSPRHDDDRQAMSQVTNPGCPSPRRAEGRILDG